MVRVTVSLHKSPQFKAHEQNSDNCHCIVYHLITTKVYCIELLGYPTLSQSCINRNMPLDRPRGKTLNWTDAVDSSQEFIHFLSNSYLVQNNIT